MIKSPEAIATGALMLIKKEVFEKIGGFSRIKGEMFDDVGLARELKKKQLSGWIQIGAKMHGS